MATIDTATAPRAALLGAALSGANRTNLALTLAASASIAEAGLDEADTTIAIGVFVALCSLTVAGSVLFYLVAADRAANPVTASYPIVAPPDGPRLLTETDLFISPDRAREFLNRASFDHLRDTLPAATADDLQAVFGKLAEAAAPK